MKITLEDLDRLQKNGVGGFTTAEEQQALIELAREGLKSAQPRMQADDFPPSHIDDGFCECSMCMGFVSRKPSRR